MLVAGLLTTVVSGCGGSTQTVTVASTPPATRTNTTTTTNAQTSTSTTSAPTMSTTSEASTTRTAPEPAFAEQEAKSEESGSAQAAAAVVRSHGFTPNDLSEYHPEQTLRVLVGTFSGSQEGLDQRAFFFLDGRYLGTDAKEPSAKLKVVAQSDSEVAIAYSLFRPGEQPCCSRGTQTIVHFQLNDGKLATAQAIPPAHSSTGASRN
jgi:hypothetical protein